MLLKELKETKVKAPQASKFTRAPDPKPPQFEVTPKS
tara:strand:+ start:205 stop:315 length:111 start_codon:yes stop_codon:yes gene_type:complete